MFDPTTFTGFHTWLSLIAMAAGIIVLIGLFSDSAKPTATAIFLATAVATSATGYGFPFTKLLPSHIVGAVALLVLVIGILARYAFHLVGPWRWVYALSAVISLYLLVFVTIAQSFQKVPALNALAPTLSEPPFAASQGVTLVIFAILAFLAARRFHPMTESGMV